MNRKIQNPFRIISLICFLISLTQIGFNNEYGIELLLFGWSFDLLFSSWANLCWTSNVLLFYSFFQRKKPKKAFFVGLIAFILASSFWFYHSINDTAFCETCNKPIPVEIQNLELGYYLWVLSFLFNLLHLIIQNHFKKD
jgi:hypothetical protein